MKIINKIKQLFCDHIYERNNDIKYYKRGYKREYLICRNCGHAFSIIEKEEENKNEKK